MKTVLGLALVLAQAPIAEGLLEVERLAQAGKTDEALALTESLLQPDAFSRWRERATAHPGWRKAIVEAAEPLFDSLGMSDLSGPERAAVHHARGVVLAGAEKRSEAAAEFEKARALAGPGDLRLDATYDAGWSWLAEGEAFRSQIPEISGAQPAPPAAAPSEPPKVDPLAQARSAYVAARERFVDRLRLDAHDEDTRANVELVQRRLRELDEIEKKREEEKKKQEDQQKQDKKDSGQQEKDDQQKKDQEKKDSESDSERKPDEKPPEAKPEEKPPEKPPDQSDPSDSDQAQKQEKPEPSKEELLTREQVMRLLDVLKGREEEGKKLLEQLRNARRAPVKKDW